MHLFPSTLDDLPSKWYKMEESRGETFVWNELKEKFTKEFKFIPEDEKLVEAMKQMKTFIQPTVSHTSTQNHNQPKESCNNIRSNRIRQSIRLLLENEHTH